MVLRLEPVAQIPGHAGEETGFADAEGKSYAVKLDIVLYECGQAGYEAPGNHDAGNPAAGTEFGHKSTSRYFQKEIPKEEDAGTKAKDGTGKAEIGIHLKGSKPDIDAVQNGNSKTEEQEWNQPSCYFMHGTFFYIRNIRCCCCHKTALPFSQYISNNHSTFNVGCLLAKGFGRFYDMIDRDAVLCQEMFVRSRFTEAVLDAQAFYFSFT